MTNVIGVRNNPQDLQVAGRRAGKFSLFSPSADTAVRPDDSTALCFKVEKEALKVVFFRLHDISVEDVDHLIPAYVKKGSSERVVISTELGRQRSRFQSRFFTDMGTICKRLTEGDDFLGLFDLALVAERRTFWMKVGITSLLRLLLLINSQHANRANIINGFNYAGSAVELYSYP